MERGDFKVNIDNVEYYQHCLVRNGQEHPYEAIDIVYQRNVKSTYWGMTSGDVREMRFRILTPGESTSGLQVDLSFSAGLIDLVSHRGSRRVLLFEWIVRNTFQHRLDRWQKQLREHGLLQYSASITLLNNGDVYDKGVLKGNLRGAWHGGTTRPTWMKGSTLHNGYALVIGLASDNPFQFDVCWNRDVMAALIQQLSESGSMA